MMLLLAFPVRVTKSRAPTVLTVFTSPPSIPQPVPKFAGTVACWMVTEVELVELDVTVTLPPSSGRAPPAHPYAYGEVLKAP